MLFDLRGFRGGTDEVVREFPPSAFSLAGEDFRVVAPVHLTAKITKDAQKVRVAGRVQTTLDTGCSRCLESFTIPVDAPFDLLFLPDTAGEPAGAASDEQETQDDDVGVSFYKDDVIDLGAVVREQLFLAMPMKPLCREDCRGLCPVCGVNRNREECSCAAQWEDPRMAPLKKLLDRK